jgi:hypothetical protein
MQEARARIGACLARLSECLRRVFGLRRGLGPDVLHHRYLGVVGNVRLVHRDVVHQAVLVPERFQDGLAPELRVEIPATGGLGLLPKERQNLLDIVDPRALRR